MTAFRDLYRTMFSLIGAPLADAHAVAESLLAETEQRLGIAIPPALRDYVAVAGNETRINRSFEEFLPLQDWKLHDGQLIFAAENQGVVLWSVGLDEGDDPEVQVMTPDFVERHDSGQRCSVFLQCLCVYQCTSGEVFPYFDNFELGSVDEVPDLPGVRMIADFDGLRTYAGQDLAISVLYTKAQASFSITSPCPGRIEQFAHLARLPVSGMNSQEARQW
ncbi:hypothetical protein GCM10007874_61820 [Labrys miyagiensis]|uniref:SMI1/KNR4 family protein n=1 Tax=Labrys miyagiensis TaxID=346912 RepID=A0ABQ6CS73_9HYPH|nr:hypothetical protein [Labrys miyagiensis]GLS23162.1 hypothetical protein GCM10007874_61820 [Labrys miyagiensis]